MANPRWTYSIWTPWRSMRRRRSHILSFFLFHQQLQILEAETQHDKDDEKRYGPAKNGTRSRISVIIEHLFLGRQRRDAVVPDRLDSIVCLAVHVVFMENVVVVFAQIAVGNINVRLIKIVAPRRIVIGRCDMPINQDGLSLSTLVHEWLGIFVGAGHMGHGRTQRKLPVILWNDVVFWSVRHRYSCCRRHSH